MTGFLSQSPLDFFTTLPVNQPAFGVVLMAYCDAFIDFLNEHNLGTTLEDPGGGEPFIFLFWNEVNVLVKDNYAIDASKGGLVIGKFHSEGGVHMLIPFKNGFKYLGEMEGYEFLVRPNAVERHLEKIDQINNANTIDKALPPHKFHVPAHIRKIDLTALHFNLIILSSGTPYIVNRAATEKNLELLNRLNSNNLWDRLRHFLK